MEATDKELMERFVGEYDNPNTRTSYKKALDDFEEYAKNAVNGTNVVIFLMPHVELRQIIKDWLWEKGRLRNSTLRHHLSILSGFCSWLILEGYRNHNPALRIKLPDRQRRKKAVYPTTQLADRLILHITTAGDKKSLRDVLVVRTLRESGVRSAELTSLTPADIDGMILHVRSGKGGKERITLVSERTSELLQTYIERREIDKNAPVFKISRPGIWAMLERRSNEAGFTEFETKQCKSPHAWRHLFATEMLSKKVPDYLVKMMAGWSDGNKDMLTRYTIQDQLVPELVSG
jgi:site-specific recombinase XerD